MLVSSVLFPVHTLVTQILKVVIQMMLSIVRVIGEGVDVEEFVVIKGLVEVVGVKSRIRSLEKDGLHKWIN